jgi:hypothetical protein
MNDMLSWEGKITAVQPRIRLLRSFDERSHSYLGYSLLVESRSSVREEKYRIGIGKAAQTKNQFRVGDTVRGESHQVADPRLESVDIYKTSGLTLIERGNTETSCSPPWFGVPPELGVYRERGRRRLSSRAYESDCSGCIWGCRMAVEIIVDHWNPTYKRYRFETFCYGPKSCPLYRAGPARKVPGRKGMTWVEEDWVDEEATAHREMDE